MRPMVLSRESEELIIGEVKKEDVICQSNQVLGNGAVNGIYDVVIVDYEKFDRGKSKDVATEVAILLGTVRAGIGRGIWPGNHRIWIFHYFHPCHGDINLDWRG